MKSILKPIINTQATNLMERKLDDYSTIEIIVSLFHLNPEQTVDFVTIIGEYAVSKDFEIRNDFIEILNFL